MEAVCFSHAIGLLKVSDEILKLVSAAFLTVECQIKQCQGVEGV